MKRIYVFLATLLLASGVAAQNPTAYFMEGTTFRSQFNPAFAPLRGYVNIPGLGGIDINASGNLAVDKLLYPRNGKLVTLLDEAVSTRQALSGLNADNLLNNPDFRAAERAFQLMMQVAGRAGRRSDGGEVVIQTSEPGHPVIRQVAAGDYDGMARAQLAEREAFFYPPYARLTLLTLRHRDVALLRRGITELAARLRGRFGRRVLGPMTPPVDRIRGEYLAGLLLKVESGASSARARELLGAELKAFSEDPEFRNITVVVNVDPQ